MVSATLSDQQITCTVDRDYDFDLDDLAEFTPCADNDAFPQCQGDIEIDPKQALQQLESLAGHDNGDRTQNFVRINLVLALLQQCVKSSSTVTQNQDVQLGKINQITPYLPQNLQIAVHFHGDFESIIGKIKTFDINTITELCIGRILVLLTRVLPEQQIVDLLPEIDADGNANQLNNLLNQVQNVRDVYSFFSTDALGVQASRWLASFKINKLLEMHNLATIDCSSLDRIQQNPLGLVMQQIRNLNPGIQNAQFNQIRRLYQRYLDHAQYNANSENIHTHQLPRTVRIKLIIQAFSKIFASSRIIQDAKFRLTDLSAFQPCDIGSAGQFIIREGRLFTTAILLASSDIQSGTSYSTTTGISVYNTRYMTRDSFNILSSRVIQRMM